MGFFLLMSFQQQQALREVPVVFRFLQSFLKAESESALKKPCWDPDLQKMNTDPQP